MKVIIIEDELPTAEYLQQSLTSLNPGTIFPAILQSVADAIEYFKHHPEPDLIFSDISLGDGLSFDIFNAVSLSCPVIFCTAFDQYALDAFKANGVDYLLKPFTFVTIKSAMAKFKSLHPALGQNKPNRYADISRLYEPVGENKINTLLVNFQDKIIPVRLTDIAYFSLEYEQVQLHTFDLKSYMIDKTLEQLQGITGSLFFRVNRKSLVSRKTIINASAYFSRRLSLNLSVTCPEPIIVSREKVPPFLEWLKAG